MIRDSPLPCPPVRKMQLGAEMIRRCSGIFTEPGIASRASQQARVAQRVFVPDIQAGAR